MKRIPHRQQVVSVACLLLGLPYGVVSAAGLRDQALAYRQEGYAMQQRGDLEGALVAYQKSAALDPSYPTPQNDAGVLLEQMGRFDEAKRAYEQALAIDPKYLKAHANLAMLYERLGEQDKAVYHWTKRHELGDAYDPWTIRAEERLVALGALKNYPGVKAKVFTRRRVADEEFKTYEQTVDEFHNITEESGNWP